MRFPGQGEVAVTGHQPNLGSDDTRMSNVTQVFRRALALVSEMKTYLTGITGDDTKVT